MTADPLQRRREGGTSRGADADAGAVVALHINWGLLSLPALLFLIFSFGLPIGLLAFQSLERFAGPAQATGPLSLHNFVPFVSDPLYLRVLVQTFTLGAIVVAICAALGYPVAYFLARTNSQFRSVLVFCVFGPLLISSVIRNLGWLPLLGSNGFVNWALLSAGLISQPLPLLNNFTGIVIGTVHAMLPFMILMLMAVLQGLDPQLEEAAANLGAGPWSRFWLVVFPLSLPGLVGGCLIVFTLTVSAYTTPAMLGGNRVLVLSTFIAQQVRSTLNYPAGAALAVVLMAIAVGVSLLATRWSKGIPA